MGSRCCGARENAKDAAAPPASVRRWPEWNSERVQALPSHAACLPGCSNAGSCTNSVARLGEGPSVVRRRHVTREGRPLRKARPRTMATDDRGESLVAKHLARQREAFEAAACEELAKLAASFTPELHRMALQACAWDVAAAHTALREFAASVGGREGADAPADSDSSLSGSRRKRSKDKRKGKDKDRKEKDRKRRRGDPAPPQPAQASFGKYGVVKLEDQWQKQPEFFAWLQECKQRDPETLAKWEEKELFKEYAEDYNTATLPHAKYYDLQRWHSTQAASADAEGGHAAGVSFTTLEEDRKRELLVERERAKDGSKRDLIEHMRLTGKLDGLREQQQLKAQLQLAAQTGDMVQVERIQKLLQPEGACCPRTPGFLSVTDLSRHALSLLRISFPEEG